MIVRRVLKERLSVTADDLNRCDTLVVERNTMKADSLERQAL